ncbi:MAG: ABC transporter permease subunit [Spirochaetes bacterium]|nr:ABC transporter permease subunit [Spirochaetota bacterium]
MEQFKEIMKGAKLIAKKELSGYFSTPIGYIVISVFLVIAGFLFFSTFFLYGQAELRAYFELLPLLFAFVIPAVTMRLFAEERNTGSFEMLMTLPLSTVQVVIGKIMAATLFAAVMISPTLVYAISVAFVGSLDIGPVIGGYVGAVLLAAAYASIGVFASSMTKNQIVAFIIGFAICIVLSLITKFLYFISPKLVSLFEYISADYHFQNIARGVVDSRNIIYFASVIVLSSMASIYQLEVKR